MRGYLVAGNWKMNGSNAANAELLDGIIAGMPQSDSVELLVCPPFPYLAAMAAKLSGTGIALGAQNVSQHQAGAYTGETAPSMLGEVGCKYVIVGHSERRAIMGESSETVAAKFQAAQDAGLIPLLCVGESQQQRETNQTEAVIDEQLNAVVDGSGIEAFRRAVIAYEPVWAIGTGLTATPQQAQDVHRHIREVLAARQQDVAATVKILYGGSVKGDNAAGLFGKPDIDGGLIGGASLNSADFLAIAEAAAALN
ncbi:MAG: triose-phosphate isomerase [Proteobacteria bacterium]|nr:triose-phosphate isomerase [Pseudomonadota bacterium]